MKRNTRYTTLVIGMAAITLGASNLSALRPAGGDAPAKRGTQPPPPSCVITIAGFNTAVVPLTLDLTRSGYRSTTGNEATFDQAPGSPGPLVTVPVARTVANVATVRVLGACGVSRRYRFLLRNALGVEKELIFPSPAAFTPATVLAVGDVHRVF